MNKKNTKIADKKSDNAIIDGPQNSFLAKNDKWVYAALAVILFLVAYIRNKFNLIPFERDEGIYGYIGTLILEGKTPYTDFYEQKFPGLFYFYGMMVYFFGDTVKGLHTGFMYLNLVTIIFLFFACKKLFNSYAALIAAITFGIVSLTPNLSGFTVQSEHGVAFFISLGALFYSLFVESQKKYYIFLMGIALGLAFMTKTSGLFLVLWGGSTFVLSFLFAKNKNFKNLLIQVSIYSGAVFLVVALFFLIIYIQGSFEQMIYWAYKIPKYYVNRIQPEDGIKYFKYTRDAIVENYKFFWIHALLALPACLLKGVSWNLKLTMLLLLFFSFCTIVPGFYFYGHYWIQTLPGLAILSAFTYYSVETALDTMFKKKITNLRIIYLAAFCLLVANHVLTQKSYYFHPNYTRILRQVYGSNPFPEAMEIANYINSHSKPEDQIVLIGSEPQIYFYTKKKSPSRHAYFASVVTDVPQHKEWQREFVKDVENAQPRYIVFFNHAISLFVQPNTDQYVFEWANKYITEGYHLIGVADMVDGMQTSYVWNEGLAGFQPKGQNVIYTYERNTENASTINQK